MFVLFVYGNVYKSKRIKEIRHYLATYHDLQLRNYETSISSCWVEKQDGRSCRDIPFLN